MELLPDGCELGDQITFALTEGEAGFPFAEMIEPSSKKRRAPPPREIKVVPPRKLPRVEALPAENAGAPTAEVALADVAHAWPDLSTGTSVFEVPPAGTSWE